MCCFDPADVTLIQNYVSHSSEYVNCHFPLALTPCSRSSWWQVSIFTFFYGIKMQQTDECGAWALVLFLERNPSLTPEISEAPSRGLGGIRSIYRLRLVTVQRVEVRCRHGLGIPVPPPSPVSPRVRGGFVKEWKVLRVAGSFFCRLIEWLNVSLTLFELKKKKKKLFQL